MKQVLAISIFLFSMMSCDPGLINNYVVENESDLLVEVNFRLQEGHRTFNETDIIQRIKIEPKSKIEFVEYGEIGNAYDKEGDILEAFDTISIQSNGIPLKKGVRERNNWNFRVVKEGLFSMDEVEYKLVVRNEDLNE